jgi:hypothetical protein
MNKNTMTHLYCLMQNRLGAMDRVLNALTHRGIIPQRMISAIRNGKGFTGKELELVVSFHANDAKFVDKLVKFLQKQVYTLEVRYANLEDPETPENSELKNPETERASGFTPNLVTELYQLETQRRMAHAHNA